MAVRRVEVGRVEKDDSVLVVQVVVRRRETLCKEVFFSLSLYTLVSEKCGVM